jgi:hypothetical protein
MFSKTNIRFGNPKHPEKGFYENDCVLYDVVKVKHHNKIAVNLRFQSI